MIEYSTGSIFDSHCEALVNPVNCVGVSGAGLALEFKKRFPRAHLKYAEYCRAGNLDPGEAFTDYDYGHQLIFLATKKHWRDGSNLEWIRDGAVTLRELIGTLRLQSIAVPALGCGYGGLDWADVKAVIEDELTGLKARVVVYPPR